MKKIIQEIWPLRLEVRPFLIDSYKNHFVRNDVRCRSASLFAEGRRNGKWIRLGRGFPVCTMAAEISDIQELAAAIEIPILKRYHPEPEM